MMIYTGDPATDLDAQSALLSEIPIQGDVRRENLFEYMVSDGLSRARVGVVYRWMVENGVIYEDGYAVSRRPIASHRAPSDRRGWWFQTGGTTLNYQWVVTSSTNTNGVRW